jgi:hypothetical protein
MDTNSQNFPGEVRHLLCSKDVAGSISTIKEIISFQTNVIKSSYLLLGTCSVPLHEQAGGKLPGSLHVHGTALLKSILNLC